MISSQAIQFLRRRAGVDGMAGPGCRRPRHVPVRGDVAWAQADASTPTSGDVVLSHAHWAVSATLPIWLDVHLTVMLHLKQATKKLAVCCISLDQRLVLTRIEPPAGTTACPGE